MSRNRHLERDLTININSKRYYNSAKSLHLPVQPRAELNGFELKLAGKHYFFLNNDTPFNNSSSSTIAIDKYCTNTLLAAAHIPVPKAISLNVHDFQPGALKEAIAHLHFPLVIKPLTGSLGLDVLCNIQSLEELSKHLTHHFTCYDDLIIEEFHAHLKSYRVLVFNNKIVGVVLCLPASVIGDGKKTLQELIHATNEHRKQLSDPEISPIVVDEECHIKLKEIGKSLDYIPSSGEKVVLAYTSNGTRGGSYESLPLQMCKENRQLMIKAAKVLDLKLAGIDLECENIMRPMFDTKGVILEVNCKPSLSIHESPTYGKPLAVSKKIMRSFICRHPLSYLYTLYSSKPTAVYIRSFLLMCLAGLVYLEYNAHTIF